MTEHYSLGLAEQDRVDEAFGGGFPAGSLVLVEGAHGAGKSALAQRFAYGVVAAGATAAYVSTELSAGTFVEQMHSLSYDVVDFLLEDRLCYLPVDLDTFARSPPRELLSKLIESGTVWAGELVFVDAFSALVRNDPRIDAVRERADEDHAMETFVAAVERRTATGTTAVLTVDPEELTGRALQPLRGAADVYLRIETSAVGQDIRRSVQVRRFVGMESPVDDTVGFSVQQGRGVTIESRTVA